MSVSPLYIEIALHYHCCVGEFERINAPACKEVIHDMMGRGLLCVNPNKGELSDAYYLRTEALAVWIEALCAVPFPVQQWIIPS